MTSWSFVGGPGRSRGLCWRSCATLEAYVGGLGPLLGPLWAMLGCSWGLRGRSWQLSGPLLAFLCCSWGLCWRSCGALGAYVGGLGPLLGPMLAVLGRLEPKNAKNVATLKMCLFLERECDLWPGGRS